MRAFGAHENITQIIYMSTDYVVAIPSYNRTKQLIDKTLQTLKRGGVPTNIIHIFVANKQQETLYKNDVPADLYGKMVVGKKGIANQRKFISSYFPEGKCVVSIDDDVEKVLKLRAGKLAEIKDLDKFFRDAFALLRREGLYLWGVYPVTNPFFMKDNVSTGLKFVIGVLHGYINRHSADLKPSTKAESKEDYHQSILFFLKDGGLIRYNNVTTKTKFNAPGGLGTDRAEMNLHAAEFLEKKYPDLVRRADRKNGMPEIRLANLPREK